MNETPTGEIVEYGLTRSERYGDWFCTRTGKRFYVLDPREEDIDIESICWSLANLCRFGGHSEFYSVGQHSCLVHDRLPQHYKLCGLLHDATESGYMDLPKPLKQSVRGYKELENKFWKVIASKWGLSSHIPEAVKVADMRMLLTERDQIMPKCENTAGWWMDKEFRPYDIKIEPWIPARTRAEFMKRFNDLAG